MTTNVPPNWFYDTLPQDLLVFSFVSKFFLLTLMCQMVVMSNELFFFFFFFLCVCVCLRFKAYI